MNLVGRPRVEEEPHLNALAADIPISGGINLRPIAIPFAALLCLLASPSFALEPLCGDVNETSSVTSTDALLVLRDAVGQPVMLRCPDFAVPATCGNGLTELGEGCDGLDLNGRTCESAGFLAGKLACSGCALDTSACTNDRYTDNGDGTVTDHQTRLMWQKSTDCTGCVVDKDNTYSWSSPVSLSPDGSVFLTFLAELNGPSPFAGYDDWRLPTITELQSIADCSFGDPCIDQSIFGLVLPDHAYWTSSSYTFDHSRAWYVYSANGLNYVDNKRDNNYARAVRSLP